MTNPRFTYNPETNEWQIIPSKVDRYLRRLPYSDHFRNEFNNEMMRDTILHDGHSLLASYILTCITLDR